LNEFPAKGWRQGSIDSLLKKILLLFFSKSEVEQQVSKIIDSYIVTVLHLTSEHGNLQHWENQQFDAKFTILGV